MRVNDITLGFFPLQGRQRVFCILVVKSPSAWTRKRPETDVKQEEIIIIIIIIIIILISL